MEKLLKLDNRLLKRLGGDQSLTEKIDMGLERGSEDTGVEGLEES